MSNPKLDPGLIAESAPTASEGDSYVQIELAKPHAATIGIPSTPTASAVNSCIPDLILEIVRLRARIHWYDERFAVLRNLGAAIPAAFGRWEEGPP